MNSQETTTPVYNIVIRTLFLFLIIAWCLAILYPFASIILWSLILGIAMKPLHDTITKWFGGRKKLAAFAIIFVILAIVIVPTGLLIESLFKEVKDVKTSYDNGTLTIPPPPQQVKEWPVIGEKLYDTWSAASVDIEKVLIKHKDQLIGTGKKLASGILSAAGSVVQIIVALIIAGILLIVPGVGESIRKFFRKLAGSRGDEFADMTVKTVGNVVKGILGVALILAILHGIIFLLVGIPLAGIWTLVIFVLAVLQIPLFIVTVPIIIYLFATKSILAAILWAITIIVAGTSDNILRPVLLAKGAPVPMLVIFIGVIGGFIFSGFIGLFTGAIIFSLGYKLFVEWINT
jgi:predicted PurR-regulated permease PerM